MNTSDSNGNVCVDDEITLNAGSQPTGPSFNFSHFPLSAIPTNNPYVRYRIYMEAENNSACSGSPCLPELTTVNLNASNELKYYGDFQEIKTKSPITYNELESIKVLADDCVTFQLSPDGTNYYYWLSNSWSKAISNSQSTTQIDLQNNILNYSNQFGTGILFVKALLKTNINQSQNCSIESIDIDYSK